MNYNSHYFSRKAAAVFLNMDEWKSITCAWTWGIFTFGDFLNNLHIYFLLRTFFLHPKYAIWSIMTIGSLNPSLQVGWGFQFFFFFTIINFHITLIITTPTINNTLLKYQYISNTFIDTCWRVECIINTLIMAAAGLTVTYVGTESKNCAFHSRYFLISSL